MVNKVENIYTFLNKKHIKNYEAKRLRFTSLHLHELIDVVNQNTKSNKGKLKLVKDLPLKNKGETEFD